MATVKNILIIAPSASEAFGGESILPVHYFRRLPEKGVSSYLLVHERTRSELERLFPKRTDQMFFIKDTRMHRFLFSCAKLLPRKLAGFSLVFELLIDLLTERTQVRLARNLVKIHEIDLIHVPIRVSPKMPSFIHGLGVPVVFGPLNGGMIYPNSFVYLQSKAERYFTKFGRILSNLANRVIPGKYKATTIAVSNNRTREALPKTACENIVTLVENGVDVSLFSHKGNKPKSNNPVFKFTYLGRLVDWKCIDLLFEAAKILKSHRLQFRLDIIGDGKERRALELLTEHLDIQEEVRFLGFVPQSECPELLLASDCLVLPSMYECGGAVVLEAMAMGKPVIATDWGGPADYLDANCGILVSPDGNKEEFIQKFAKAMESLIDDPELAARLGSAGPAKIANEYDWSKKIDNMIEIYEQSVDLFDAQNTAITASR